MTPPPVDPRSEDTPGLRFTTTHWSAVLSAGHGDGDQASKALQELCRTYWPPLYAFARRSGHSREDAEDLTQGFVASLLARNDFAKVHPDKGRFRSFLLAALKHYLANEWRKTQRIKRGGGIPHLPADLEQLETRLNLADPSVRSPDAEFDRRWALTVLDVVLARLRSEQRTAGREAQFDQLLPILTGDTPALPYVQLAGQQGTTEAAVKMTVHRLRHRYKELLRTEIAQTLADPSDVEPEIRELIGLLRP